jgi:uncharacterized Zn-finger protein
MKIHKKILLLTLFLISGKANAAEDFATSEELINKDLSVDPVDALTVLDETFSAENSFFYDPDLNNAEEAALFLSNFDTSEELQDASLKNGNREKIISALSEKTLRAMQKSDQDESSSSNDDSVEKSSQTTYSSKGRKVRKINYTEVNEEAVVNGPEKSNKSKKSLKSHKKHRTEKTIHQCPHCDKSFNKRYCLNRHMNIHTRATLYICEICSKTFTDLSNYNQHINLHTREKVYPCNICAKIYLNSGTLNRHKSTKKHLALSKKP